MAGDDIEDAHEFILRDQAERVAYTLGCNRTFADRDHLVGEAERVTHRTIRGAGNRRNRILVNLDAFGAEDCRKPPCNVREPNAFEIEPLEATENRRGGLS